MEKSADAFRTISEVSDALETPAHVLRFWESRFPQIRPVKRAGGRRYYRPADVALLAGIRRLLHDEGMTIRGVQKILREQGVRHVAGLSDAPQGDAYAAMGDDADALFDAPSEQPGFSFGLPEPLPSADVIRPDFAGSAAPPEATPAESAVPDDAATEARVAENWPPAELPLMEQPFAPSDVEEFPHWGETVEPGRQDDAAEVEPEADRGDEPAAAGAWTAVDDLESVLADEAAQDDAGFGHEPEPGEAAYDAAPDGEQVDPDTVASRDAAAGDGLTEDAPASTVTDLPEPGAPPVAADAAAAEAPADPVWRPSLLRALPRGALHRQAAAVVPLAARLLALRDRMADAAKPPRK